MFTGPRRIGTSGIRRVALAQAGLAPIAALAGWMFAGPGAAAAALYGVLVALAVSAVLVWREGQSMRHPEWDQHRLFKLFIRAANRAAGAPCRAAGRGARRAEAGPLPMLLGLVLAQLAWLAAATAGRDKT
jgi:ATP synthase protein I